MYIASKFFISKLTIHLKIVFSFSSISFITYSSALLEIIVHIITVIVMLQDRKVSVQMLSHVDSKDNFKNTARNFEIFLNVTKVLNIIY